MNTALQTCQQQVACDNEYRTDSTTLSLNDVSEYLESINAKHKDIILAAAVLESAKLSSSLVGSNNNLFGMRHPTQRVTLSLGSTNGYATYPCWTSSIIDYVLWMQLNCRQCVSDDDVLDTLQRVYAEDPNYKNKLKSLIDSLQSR